MAKVFVFSLVLSCISFAVHGKVVDLNSSNFEKIVNDGEKDVLVEFYAPSLSLICLTPSVLETNGLQMKLRVSVENGCGHCKRLAPIYEEVGETFKNEPNCVVAKLDADSEKALAQKYGVSGYPTIKFFPKDDKKGQEYDKGRDKQDFVDFLNEKCKTNRVSGGGLTEDAGRIQKYDDFAKKFMVAGKIKIGEILDIRHEPQNEQDKNAIAVVKDGEVVGHIPNGLASTKQGTAIVKHFLTKTGSKAEVKEERESIMKDAVDGIEGEDDKKMAKYYTKIMEKVTSAGDSFIDSEIDRIGRLLEGSMSAKKQDEFMMRRNVLKQFPVKSEKTEL